MTRRTKIVATIGPASDSESTLRELMKAGMDVARLALAHGSLDESLERYRRVRSVAADLGLPIGILADLPGPKVRCASFGEDGIDLITDDRIRLTVGEAESTASTISVDYDQLLGDIQPGDRLKIGDGSVVIDVVEADGSDAIVRVASGGTVRGRPGLHVPADRLSMSTPTPDDFGFIDAFVEAGVDMLAVSFVRSGHDIRRVGTEPHPRGPLVIAKVETRSAVDNLDGIIEASGAIMVARGDLGNECAIEDLPTLQKTIISRCIAGGLPVITATQMLESMISNTAPTRAEASDVANAVWDGSSAVMLSAETAIGIDPVNVLRTMSRIARRADEEFDHAGWAEKLTSLHMTSSESNQPSVTDAMTHAAWRAATELGVKTILCISGSGFTVRSMARFRPKAKIVGVSSNERTVAVIGAGMAGFAVRRRAISRMRSSPWQRLAQRACPAADSGHGLARESESALQAVGQAARSPC
ncbi:MAG: pyruvate kinase [Acidobacteria bacterium]|nr:pyruvate kinase [Acidobacteriota bacterium]